MIRSLSRASLAALLLVSSLLGGCGGGSSGDPSPDSTDGGAGAASDEPAFADPAVPGVKPELPTPLLLIKADPDRSGNVPAVVDVETLADSGLQIAYTELSQRTRVEPLRVGAQWQHMQSCVNVVAPPPLVLVRARVEPFAVTDDVIRDFEGRISASASALVDGVAILQVRDAVFDGSRADAGFGLLRQIMGRHLWLSAGLLERFYPSECAREVPPEPLSGTFADPLSREL